MSPQTCVASDASSMYSLDVFRKMVIPKWIFRITTMMTMESSIAITRFPKQGGHSASYQHIACY